MTELAWIALFSIGGTALVLLIWGVVTWRDRGTD